jgi:hypothetical protein
VALAAVSSQIQRVMNAIDATEAKTSDLAVPLWNAIEAAQEIVNRIGQKNYEELLDLQADAMQPFWPDRDEARQIGRTSRAVQDIITRLVRHNSSPGDP